MTSAVSSALCVAGVLIGASCNVGCTAGQLRYRVTRRAASIPDIYYQEVLNNLAMIQADPSRMPYFSDPQTARSRVQQTSDANYGLNLDLTPGDTETLTRLTLAILDIHTFQSERVGGSRVQPGILPR